MPVVFTLSALLLFVFLSLKVRSDRVWGEGLMSRVSQNRTYAPYWPYSWSFPCQKYRIHTVYICRVGQNRIYTPYMTVYLVMSLPKIPYIYRIYMVLANPTDEVKARWELLIKAREWLFCYLHSFLFLYTQPATFCIYSLQHFVYTSCNIVYTQPVTL